MVYLDNFSRINVFNINLLKLIPLRIILLKVMVIGVVSGTLIASYLGVDLTIFSAVLSIM
jgi:hypothetical protein